MGDPRLQHIAENFDSMKRDINDTFRFHCTQCGKCCINREDILMSPQDVFKAAQALQMTPHDFVQLYCECYLGSSSRMPIVRLQPRGSIKRCPLLKDRKCMIHDAKPAVCAMFPLGRAIRIDKEDAEKDELPPMKLSILSIRSIVVTSPRLTPSKIGWSPLAFLLRMSTSLNGRRPFLCSARAFRSLKRSLMIT